MEAKTKDYGSQKKLIIQSIIEIIKKNPGINAESLLSKMIIEPPYLSEERAQNYLLHLTRLKYIRTDENNKVFPCPNKVFPCP